VVAERARLLLTFDFVSLCIYDAIAKAHGRLGSVAGTPIINADTSACMMCEDFPCIASCEPGVLTDAVPPIMGTAQITEHLCLAHHSPQPCRLG